MSQRILYPLTSPQLSIWYTEQMFPGTSISNVAGTLRIKENVDFDLFEKSINFYIKNNDALRLHLCLDEAGNPQQYVSEYTEKHIEINDFSMCEDPIKALYEWNNQETLKPFDLLDQDLYRMVFFRLSDNDNGVYVNYHHIISDAWSIGISFSIILKTYLALKNNETNQLNSMSSSSYVSFIQSEKRYIESTRYINDKALWESTFSKLPEITALKARDTGIISTKSKRKTFIAPKKFNSKLREYCSYNKINPYPLFLAALAMYINRVTHKNDLVIGTPLLNRLNHNEKNTVGLFVTTVPLRIEIDDNNSFDNLLHNIIELCASIYRHQRYPYDKILKFAREKHGNIENLYDIVISYQNTKFDKLDSLDYSTRWHFSGCQSNSLTIHINDRDNEGIIIIDYDYQVDQFYDKEIEFLHHHFLSLIWHALDNPHKKICNIEMLPESERKKVLYEFNNTDNEYPKDKLIHELFEEQANATPNNVALVFQNRLMTYRVLNEKANALAFLLRENKVQPNEVIAIMVPRSFEMVIGILAILKAGAAYLPIDPNYPENRIRYMLHNSNARILLTIGKEKNNSYDELFVYDISDPVLYKGNINNLKHMNKSSDAAYVIFTSGSTGEPKGAIIEHGALINCVYGIYKTINFSMIKNVLSVTSFSFDVFLIELIPGLFQGSSIYILDDFERKDPNLMAEIIIKKHIDLVVCTPSQISSFITRNDFYSSLKNIYALILAGENIPEYLLQRLQKLSKPLIYNGYGPTETTVIVTIKELSHSKRVLIGKPMMNVKIYILDEKLMPVPIGIPGEIYIGGRGLAKGYINNKELTESKFIQNPFNLSEKIYITGDLGRWYPHGEIKYIGRTDHQVKIRGIRIELEEIQKKILKYRYITSSYVTVIDREGNKALCAYYVSAKEININSLKKYLMNELPAFMIPTYFVKIDEIPITPNGKVNIKKLPEPCQEKQKSRRKNKPNSKVEQELLEIWKEVLRNQDIDIKDEFYTIGGDSLSIIQITSRINAKYNVNIPISTLNKTTSVRDMSKYIIKDLNSTKHNSEFTVNIREGQNRNLFLIHAGNGEVICYNDLSETISKSYNVWGLQVNDDFLNLNRDIHQLAIKYADCILRIQPEGQYLLGGWCIGGTIAFEIASIFEQSGKEVVFLGLFNSIAPNYWRECSIFSNDDERKFLYVCLNNYVKNYENLETEKLWDELFSLLENGAEAINEVLLNMPEYIKIILPKQCFSVPSELARYMKRIVILHKARINYFPTNKISTVIHFFCATEDFHIKDPNCNIERWSECCMHNVVQHSITANHYTLLQKPNVGVIGNMLNDILDPIEHEV